MPDTGAPWNIPYVAGTDLVADWPTDSQTLATAIADGLDNASVIVQVAQTVKTDTFSTTTSGFQDVTGLAVTVTPSSATNKVLLIAQVNATHTATTNAHAYIRISGGNATTYVGDAAGSRTRVASGRGVGSTMAGGYLESLYGATAVYLDSPATTGATTYQVQISRNAGTVYVNRSTNDSNAAFDARGASSITAIEVAA